MKKKIMLIDDSVTIHRVIDLCVDKDKYDVVKVFTKDEALRVIPDEKPDLILLDNKLGDVASKDMITAIRGAAGRVYIVLLTGAFDQFDSNLCFLVGADDFIYKPFDAKTLDEKVQKGMSGVSQFEVISESEHPTDEELLAAMAGGVPDGKMESLLIEESAAEENEPEETMVQEVIGEEPSAEEVTIDEPAFEEPIAEPEVSVEDDINSLLAEVGAESDIKHELHIDEEIIPVQVSASAAEISFDDDVMSDFIPEKPSAPAGEFDGLIEVDEEQLMAEEEHKKEEERLAAELALTVTPEPEPVQPELIEENSDAQQGEFEGLVEVDEDFREEEKVSDVTPEEIVLDDALAVDENELTDSEQEEIFKDIEGDSDELDSILDGINEEHEVQDAHVDETLNSAEEALDETVETVLTDIQAELSLSDVMEEQKDEDEPEEQFVRPARVSSGYSAPDNQEPKDIDPEPLVRISEEKLVEAVYEAIDEDTLKYAIKEVLTDKISRILEEELPFIVERAIRKEIERLVKGK